MGINLRGDCRTPGEKIEEVKNMLDEDRRQIPNFVLSSKMRKQRKLERLMDEIIEENREALEELAQ